MKETEVLNCSIPSKLEALEAAIEMAKEDIPVTLLHSATVLVFRDENTQRLRICYDAEAKERPPALLKNVPPAKPKRRWWPFGRKAVTA